MKIIFHEDFYQVYSLDPAAASGRMESIVAAVGGRHTFIDAVTAQEEEIAAVHTRFHMDSVKRMGLYEIAALSAGAAIQAARIGLEEPCFALNRPPGHHASADSSWGFCFFNNMAVAIRTLKNEGEIKKVLVLDIDLHYGDGTINIFGSSGSVNILNPVSNDRNEYLKSIEKFLLQNNADLIGISAGFDNAQDDWGGLLARCDYTEIGRMVREAAHASGSGFFAILEGGYNHGVLGENVMALLEGMEEG